MARASIDQNLEFQDHAFQTISNKLFLRLSRIILDRISAQEASADSTLLRTAGPRGNNTEELIPSVDHPMLEKLKEMYGLVDAEAGRLALAMDGLVNLEASQRSSLFDLIASISSQGEMAN